ncbi:MAG: helix-turn-helix domain-containing protein [Betaproteobacteria bacterium]|nr:helix-turn-helix domain-containing protein [Betaproteobacteria bacterium]MDE2152343.1 helix-turn-helix domain-containing protein [Betaproteobacteria bacterium]
MRKIAVLLFPDFQILDATGPIAAFEIAERYVPGSYALQPVALQPGLVRSSSGALLQAHGARGLRGVHTLLVAGGDGVEAAAACEATRRVVRSLAARAQRVASVCSGAYLLAHSGLLDGLRATTHWSRSRDFVRRFPQVRLEADRIYIRQGRVWTSAGISAGIDLALALIAEDLGEPVARRTAQQLVFYYRRPGGQSQFSALLDMSTPGGRFAELLAFVRAHLRERLAVEDLAERAHLSPRQFSRLFHAEVGLPPARAVEALRVEAAKAALESGADSVQRVAAQCGFGNPERMRRSFQRVTGAPPSTARRRAAA